MLNTKEPLDQRITIRLSQTEKNLLVEDADLAGLTTSELIRRRYFGKPIITATDRATIRELRRVGGLLKHIFSQSDRFDLIPDREVPRSDRQAPRSDRQAQDDRVVSTEILTALNEVKECIKRIANRDC